MGIGGSINTKRKYKSFDQLNDVSEDPAEKTPTKTNYSKDDSYDRSGPDLYSRLAQVTKTSSVPPKLLCDKNNNIKSMSDHHTGKDPACRSRSHPVPSQSKKHLFPSQYSPPSQQPPPSRHPPPSQHHTSFQKSSYKSRQHQHKTDIDGTRHVSECQKPYSTPYNFRMRQPVQTSPGQQAQGSLSTAFNQLQWRYRCLRRDEIESHENVNLPPQSSGCCCCGSYHNNQHQSKMDLSSTLPLYQKRIMELEKLASMKEEEKSQLRETMERNEKAILRLFEETKKNLDLKISEGEEQMKGWVQQNQLQQQYMAKLERENFRLKIAVQNLIFEKDEISERRFPERIEQFRGRSNENLSTFDFCDRKHLPGGASVRNRGRSESRFASASSTQDVLGSADNVCDEVKASFGKREWKSVEEFSAIDVTGCYPDAAALQRGGTEGNCYLLEKNKQFVDAPSIAKQSRKPRRRREMMTSEESEKMENYKKSQTDLNKLSSYQNDDPVTSELAAVRKELDNCRKEFQEEKEIWKNEKNKVIAYQKNLQELYLQKFNLCKELEDEVRQLKTADQTKLNYEIK